MKTIRLEQARWIEPTERVTLHVGHPQQGTINRWHLGELTVRNLVEGIQTEPGLGKKVFSGRSQLPSLYLQDNWRKEGGGYSDSVTPKHLWSIHSDGPGAILASLFTVNQWLTRPVRLAPEFSIFPSVTWT
jgi:hypothetical protein